MIKELHQSNKTMREQVAGLHKNRDESANENFKLEVENRDLRDRIEMLENVIGQ